MDKNNYSKSDNGLDNGLLNNNYVHTGKTHNTKNLK